MALTKKQVVDLIEVVESGCVQVRIKTLILDNGVAISSAFSRFVVAPGDDYSKQDVRVQSICAATHNPEVIAAYKANATAV